MSEKLSQSPNRYRLYGPGEIEPVEAWSVPETAAKFFQWASGRLNTQPPIPLERFDALLKLDRDDGISTYFAVHEKFYTNMESLNKAVYLIDLLPTNDKAGTGEFYRAANDPEAKPTAWLSYTVEEYSGRGYGAQRYLAMNAAAQLLFDTPLHTDYAMVPTANRIMEQLVEEGLAERLNPAGDAPEWTMQYKYRFKTS